MENSKIEWTQHTFSPWHGCTKVSPGCKNCYADAQHNFHYSSLKAQQGTCWGVSNPRLAVSADTWKKPLKWNREAQAAGTRPRVFCASMADVFEQQSELSRAFAGQTAQVPSGPGKTRTVTFVDITAERLRLLRLIHATPHLDWLLLTKRPEHIETALCDAVDELERQEGGDSITEFQQWLTNWAVFDVAPINVWLGTSVENQEQADARIPHLLAAPAAVRFLSCEPLLSAVDLKAAGGLGTWVEPGVRSFAGRYDGPGVDWVIVGGESGAKARPMHPDWARGLRDQCQAAGVAFFFKQWGEWENHENCPSPAEHRTHDWLSCTKLTPDGCQALYGRLDIDTFVFIDKVGKHAAGRLLDGRTWDELPRVATSAPA